MKASLAGKVRSPRPPCCPQGDAPALHGRSCCSEVRAAEPVEAPRALQPAAACLLALPSAVELPSEPVLETTAPRSPILLAPCPRQGLYTLFAALLI